MHKHKAVTWTTRCFTGAVGPAKRQNRMAHGGACELSTCSCGATRRTNINGMHVERGTWIGQSKSL